MTVWRGGGGGGKDVILNNRAPFSPCRHGRQMQEHSFLHISLHLSPSFWAEKNEIRGEEAFSDNTDHRRPFH